MPVILDDLNNSANVAAIKKNYNPKFFSDILTGSGKSRGLLCQNANPCYLSADVDIPVTNDMLSSKKRTFSSGNTKTFCVPIAPVAYSSRDAMTKIPLDTSNAVLLFDNGKNKLYASMDVYSVRLCETDNTDKSSSGNVVKSVVKDLTVCYEINLYLVADSNDKTLTKAGDSGFWNSTRGSVENLYITYFTCNPVATLGEIVNVASNFGVSINPQIVADFINDFSLYENICLQSERWQTNISDIMNNVFDNISKLAYRTNPPTSKYLNAMAYQIRYIEEYNIPLDLYRNIYKNLSNKFKCEDATVLCKQNLNLLLSDTLNNLDLNRSSLNTMPVNPNNPVDISFYSPEQKAAITSTDPLILVQAGAGTGKSTVILGRIEYMIGAGINPDDITVLSFTNAAANHILDKNPNVHSMTIAKMIHEIYSTNFKHELSSIDTIINSLDIYFPGDNDAIAFKKKLKDVRDNKSDAFTQMNNFVEKHYDDIIRMLDVINQVCLELEIIICYQKIDVFNEPESVKSKYLIIDEVQDNSIFEFIYTLKYVEKHQESLFIVGDCSQTLYEFRASNPKALNVLEGSGVFSAYQLQVNYRSTQEILDFANVVLRNIEANQYANIQLQANNLTPVTEKSFTDAIKLKYLCLSKLTDANLALVNSISSPEVKEYIDEKLKAGEQITFLAYTRNTIATIEKTLNDLYPDKNVVSLVPKKMYNSTIFSDFIRLYWSEVKFAPSVNIVGVISSAIYNKLDRLVKGGNAQKALPSVQKLIGNWISEQGSTIAEWQRQVSVGLMKLDEFMDNIKHNMLSFEIRHNAVKQALLSTQNEQNKLDNQVKDANFLVSTIHSAKGLEFENVIVIHKNENNLDEDKKRMYYVAFTRAMKSEFIISYGTVKKPRIEADYDEIVADLQAKASNNP